VKVGNKYKIIDAKSSITQNLSGKTAENLAESWSTNNQKQFYDALKANQVQSIKPRGQNAIDYFENINPGQPLPSNLSIENSIEFLVNDVATDGYNMFSKILKF
jgi:hypothetical protein